MRTLITNAKIIDGTGAPAFRGDLLIEDQHIADVGSTSASADTVLDVRGMVVTPGFIDMHSHGDFALPVDPLAKPKIMQGITTEVVGNCGMGATLSNDRVDAMYGQYAPLIFGEQPTMSFASLKDYRAEMHKIGIGVNAACLVPHNNVRCAVMGMAERAPTDDEQKSMEALVDQAMGEGAFGFSTGLVYPPGAFSQLDELVGLTKRVAPFGGFYASALHARRRDHAWSRRSPEAIRVGGGLPVWACRSRTTRLQGSSTLGR